MYVHDAGLSGAPQLLPPLSIKTPVAQRGIGLVPGRLERAGLLISPSAPPFLLVVLLVVEVVGTGCGRSARLLLPPDESAVDALHICRQGHTCADVLRERWQHCIAASTQQGRRGRLDICRQGHQNPVRVEGSWALAELA